ncbi:hypothetical protein AYL99_05182 [Fonsecaea erecta]|uniref:Helicase ATP-binding domain-containing protein n=1 Tax=Fonsecaea erecta TaxID=1367422 RepID=A0A178ZK56_9EURO|nr:hypothetical protein AYL99_05182 [Fonsecaea erecta]OAP60180.1 hypothetical protein AYL99_05182 [Fonsecaea erecta]
MASRKLPPRPTIGSSSQSSGHARRQGRSSVSDVGRHLLSNLRELPKPLTTLQVDQIAQYLDEAADSGPSSSVNFKSKDLMIGQRRQVPAQPSLDESAWDPREGSSLERFDLEIQQAAFEFVRSDVRIETRIKRPQAWIQVAGVQRRLHHYQLYAAFVAIKDGTGHRRGLIEADRMGLGKTTIMYVVAYLNYLLVALEIDRQQHPERHCTENGGPCRSPYSRAIVCPCDPDGVTARFGLKGRMGATLVLAPKRLLITWKQEWRSTGIDGMSLYIQHGEFPGDAVPHYRRRCLTLEKVEGHNGSAVMEIRPDSRAHEMIVLTTTGSYWRRVQHHFRLWRPLVPAAAVADVLPLGMRTDGICWSTIVMDEAHTHIKKAVYVHQLVASLASNGWIKPNFIAVTATPMLRNGPIDMRFMIKAINMMSPDISQHPECRAFADESSLDLLCRDYQRMRRLQARGNADPHLEENVRACVSALYAAYAIQRRASSIQNGKMLVQLPPLAMYDVECPSGAQDRYRIWQVEEFLKTSFRQSRDEEMEASLAELLTHSVKARILADAPYLALYGSTELLTWSHIRGEGWHLRPEESPFCRDLREIEESSGKLQMLRYILTNLGRNAAGDDEALVVVSEFPVICLIVLILCRDLGIVSEWIHSGLDPAKREWLASNFQGTRRLEYVNRLKRHESRIRVLIGTVAIIGSGLTLHRAIRLVLMEPQHSVEVEMQTAARIHRLGVATDQCWFYRLHNPASSIEEMIMQDHAAQLENSKVVDWFTKCRGPTSVGLTKREKAQLQAYSVMDEGDEDARETISAEDMECWT